MSETQIIQLLTQIKGVGRWTVEMILIFTLGRENVFPIADLGIRRGVEIIYPELIAISLKQYTIEITQKTNNWNPYNTWVARLMWKIYDNSKNKF